MGRWIRCKQCGHMYKNTIKRCPQCFCRTPITAKKLVAIMVVIFMTIAFAGGLLWLSLTPPATSTSTPQVTTTIAAVTTSTDASKGTSATSSKPITTTTKKAEQTKNSTTQSTLKDADGAVSGTKEGKVYVTFPKWLMFAVDEKFNYQLSDADKDLGFVSVKKNSDGSATYTLNSYNDYSRCRLELGGEPKATCVGWKFQNAIKDFKYNDTLSEVALYTKYTAYEQMSEADVSMIMALGFQIMVYQYLDLDVPVGSVISVYGSEGQLLGTSAFPQAGITFYETYRK